MKRPYPIPELTEDERLFVIELIGPELPNGCMPWLGMPFCTSRLLPKCHGYVRFRNRTWAAHRVVYTITRGEIPQDFVIDHLCGYASCVNPLHLEPVTLEENSRRTGPRNREKLIAQARLERAAFARR
jgi:hypothetical protein